MKKLSNVIKFIIISGLLWTSVTCAIQSFKNIHMTNSEIFNNIPNSFVLDFK